MALSGAEKLSAFEALGITRGPGGGANEDIVTIHTGFGISLTLTEADKLRDELDVYLDTMDSDVETRVQEIIADYDEVKDSYGVSVEGGSLGDLQGVSFDVEVIKQKIGHRLANLLGVMHMVQAIKQRQGPSGGPVAFVR